jgi:serine/threonine protein kinase
MIGKTFSHYEITLLHGKGGMGEVYQAKDAVLGRAIAIKVLPDAFAQDANRVSGLQFNCKGG